MDITSYLLGKQAGGGGGGDTPAKGVILSEWDEDGFAHKLKTVGFEIIPQQYCMTVTNYATFFNKIETIEFNNGVTEIGQYACSQSKATSVIVPNTVTTIGEGAFQSLSSLISFTMPSEVISLPISCFSACSKLENINLDNIETFNSHSVSICPKINISKLPKAKTILGSAFYACDGITKMCLPLIISLTGNSQTTGSFRNCSGLKQVWIGSGISANPMTRYVFNNCTALEKMYIDLPRATVESFYGYAWAFMNDTNKTGIIVCNDDAGFITEEEFDALVV